MPSTVISRIDGLTTSVAVKAPIKIMTSSPIVLFGEQTINATTPYGTPISAVVVDGDRVGVNAQDDQTTNGIYVVRSTSWKRAKDFDGALDAVFGTLVTDTTQLIWRLTTPAPVLFGTSNITFEPGQWEGNNAGNIIYETPAGVPAVLQSLVGSMIAGNLTITVPAQFAETADAMDWLRTKTIVNGAQVTIQLTASFTPTRSTNLNHSQGGQISILGSAANPTAIRALAITPLSFDGFVCSGGNNFGLLDNFVVDATSKSEAPLNYSGIVATDGARIGCGPGMLVNNYYYSFVGRDGGVTFADSTNATNAGDVAYWGFNGGHVRARNAVGTNARDVANGLGSIFLSEYGGSVDCTGATASGALLSGIAALSGGSTRAYNSTSTGNDGDGFLARDGGVIVAHNATASSNGGYGIAQITSGRVLGNNMIFTSNALGINRPAVVLDNTSLGARLAASGGILRIDTGTGGFNTNFHSSGGLILSLLHSDSAVNNVYLAGSPTGGPVRLGATGSDTNIDIRFQTKGTGVLRYGTHTSNADAAISGYITIRDDGGTLRKLAVIS